RGVAQVEADRVASVCLDDRQQPPLDLREGLVPGGLDELAVAPHQRSAQAVGIVLEALAAAALGADEAVREDVVRVAADLPHLAVAGNLELEPAGRFAERAGRVRRRRRAHAGDATDLASAGA